MTEDGIIINEGGVELKKNKIYRYKNAVRMIRDNGFSPKDFKNSIPKWLETVNIWRNVEKLIVKDFISRDELIELSRKINLQCCHHY